jgi:DDE family transposase
MNSQVWPELYQSVLRLARTWEAPKRRLRYADALIVALFYWSVYHDRPQCWACERSNLGLRFRPRRLPSVSQLNRRIRSPRCQELLQCVKDYWAQRSPEGGLALLDSRPLRVGECSKDRHAKAGRVYGGFARGYRLHELLGHQGSVRAWEVTSMNVAESRVARRLLRQAQANSVILCDSNYDRTPLYEAAARRSAMLLAKPRKGAGQGHCRQSPKRLRSLELWRTAPREFATVRTQVERIFSQQSSFGGGLAPLPPWVRTLPRVRRWVDAKLTIYHVRLAIRRAVV